MWRQTLGPHALELTCGNTVEAFSVNDPLIFAEGFYITSEGTSAGEQLAVIRVPEARIVSLEEQKLLHFSTSLQNVR